MITEISLQGYAGAPSESAVTRCEGGLWTSYSLSCSPHDCGPFPLPSPSLSLSYPDNTTSYGSLAILSCSEGDIYRQSSLICRKVRQREMERENEREREREGERVIIFGVLSGWLEGRDS